MKDRSIFLSDAHILYRPAVEYRVPGYSLVSLSASLVEWRLVPVTWSKMNTILFLPRFLLTISHHYLGDPGLPGSLDHSVQVAAELLVGEVGPDVDDDVVAELVHHGGGPGDLSQGVKKR